MAATNSSQIGAGNPVISVNTVDLQPAQPPPSTSENQELSPTEGPDPRGIIPAQENESNREDSSDPSLGTGVDGELAVWEARYSKRNFIGRTSVRVLLTIAWGVLAYYTWSENYNLALVTWIALAVLVALWVGLIWRVIQAHYSHYYRLTNRRLFVSTGVVNRRRDMMELLRVKDVFTRQQSLMERWLGLGTVVVVPSEKELPTFYLAGVDDPKEVMDLIWHHARAERDNRSVKVDSV
jgi:membrane protein YdbS with pleckstrin-like domain